MRPLDYDSNEENNVDVNVQMDKPVNNTTEESDMLNTEANDELVKQLVELQQLEENDSSEPELELESSENILVDSDDIQLPHEVDSAEENTVDSAEDNTVESMGLIEEDINDLTDELEHVVDEENGMNWKNILLICGGVYLVYYLYTTHKESLDDLQGCILMEVTSDDIGLPNINIDDLSATSSVNTE